MIFSNTPDVEIYYTVDGSDPHTSLSSMVYNQGFVLTNNQTHVKYRPNNDVGFYQAINADGSWGTEKLSPGYTVTIGWDNFTRVFHDEGIQKPFFAIFVWTVVFSVLTVVTGVAAWVMLKRVREQRPDDTLGPGPQS